jgi:hypothetical protein
LSLAMIGPAFGTGFWPSVGVTAVIYYSAATIFTARPPGPTPSTTCGIACRRSSRSRIVAPTRRKKSEPLAVRLRGFRRFGATTEANVTVSASVGV